MIFKSIKVIDISDDISDEIEFLMAIGFDTECIEDIDNSDFTYILTFSFVSNNK